VENKKCSKPPTREWNEHPLGESSWWNGHEHHSMTWKPSSKSTRLGAHEKTQLITSPLSSNLENNGHPSWTLWHIHISTNPEARGCDFCRTRRSSSSRPRKTTRGPFWRWTSNMLIYATNIRINKNQSHDGDTGNILETIFNKSLGSKIGPCFMLKVS
jgi:hypothetical protein